MSTTNKYTVNGVIDTNNNVFDNIELLATTSGCFVTWDPALGKWAVIVNEAGSSIFSFTDSNIIGSISVGGSSMNELYNSVQLEYPHKDLRDAVDYLTVSLDSADRFVNELDNQLSIQLTTINDPIQAQLIATQELKQNRVDTIIEFDSDFVANGLKAGDLIDVTNTALGYSSKVFRVIQIVEQDTDEGAITYSITALEYDADVYSTAGLTYDLRTKNTGIPSKIINDEIAKQDDIDVGGQVGRLLAANAALGLINSLFSVDEETGAIVNEGKFADLNTNELMTAGAKLPDLTHDDGVDTTVCSGTLVTLTATHDCEVCFLTTPNYSYPYTITGCSAGEAGIPLTGTVQSVGNTVTFKFTPTVTTQKSITVQFGNNSTVFDVSPQPSKRAETVTPTSTSITEGQSLTVNITTIGISDSDTINYAITGTGTGKVTTALTGTVTITSNAGSLGITTADDSAYNVDQEITVTFTYAGEPIDYCGISQFETTIDILNNDTTGPITPNISKPGDFSCDYVEVPVVWCGTFDADTQHLKSIAVKKTALLPRAFVGGTAVPTALTVTNPGEATAAITIDTTVNIDPVTGAGGAQIDVITSFGSLPTGGDTLITGTTSTFTGYWDNTSS